MARHHLDILLVEIELRRCIHYDPPTGILLWKSPPKRKPFLFGMEAGALRPDGYITVKILGIPLLAHRIAYFLMTGNWPEEIDHINRIRNDNRWINLRNGSHLENSQNVPKRGSRSGSSF